MRERGLGRDSVAEHSPSVVGHGLHCQHCETNQGRRREGGDRAEPRLYCCVYRKTRQVNAAVQLLAQRKQMTRLTSSQGQTPALSYEREALCSAICSLVTTLVTHDPCFRDWGCSGGRHRKEVPFLVPFRNSCQGAGETAGLTGPWLTCTPGPPAPGLSPPDQLLLSTAQWLPRN